MCEDDCVKYSVSIMKSQTRKKPTYLANVVSLVVSIVSCLTLHVDAYIGLFIAHVKFVSSVIKKEKRVKKILRYTQQFREASGLKNASHFLVQKQIVDSFACAINHRWPCNGS